jgi:hypothetical protein
MSKGQPSSGWSSGWLGGALVILIVVFVLAQHGVIYIPRISPTPTPSPRARAPYTFPPRVIIVPAATPAGTKFVLVGKGFYGQCAVGRGCYVYATYENQGATGNVSVTIYVTRTDDPTHYLAACGAASDYARAGDSVTVACPADNGALEDYLSSTPSWNVQVEPFINGP